MKAVKRNEAPSGEANPRVVPRVRLPRTSAPESFDIHGLKVHFPFRPYDCQKVYMTKVIEALLRSENALLESPTGTGKTLCLLCSTLAWQAEQLRQLNQSTQFSQSTNLSTSAPPQGRVPTIIYASRTHSQLSQVVRELRNTQYRPKHCVLGSREQMCVNPKVKTASATASTINHDCSKLCKDRKCRFRNNLEGFQAPANEMSLEFGQQPIMDMEDLVAMGEEHKVCPFYYTRDQVEKAELILMPYNYLFDKDARSTTLVNVPWENSVVIFDEAHNLESFASESASFDLSTTDISGCLAEIDRVINLLQALPTDGAALTREQCAILKKHFLSLEAYLVGLGEQTAYTGEFMMEVFSRGAMITFANYELFIQNVKLVNDILMDQRGAAARNSASPKLEHFVQCIKRVYGHSMESRCLAKATNYRVYVSPKSTGKDSGRTISYWCFAPSVAMEELAGLNVGSIIVTSGTLSPLPSYSMELGIRFPHTLENPHIVKDNQIHVRVLGKGCSGKVLSSSYERRKDGEYYTELGNTLVSLAKVIPSGILVFFPSYGVMETCLERWGGPASRRPQDNKNANNFFAARRKVQSMSNQFAFPAVPTIFFDKNAPSTPWKRLLATKAVIIEPKSSADLAEAIAEFKRFLALPKSPGCVLMGVCRGKISEGIDFAHEESRAVVITGLPFAPAFDPKVKMKREYLDRARIEHAAKASTDGGFGVDRGDTDPTKLSGHEWYTQQAHRAVNQAIGRVIRNRTDYGAVLLLDARFDQSSNQEGLSKWLRPHIRKDEGFGIAIRSLVQFYKDAAAHTVEVAKQQAAQMVLEYEADGDDAEDAETERLTTVAFIRSAPSTGEATSGEGSGNYVAPAHVVARVDVKDLDKQSGSNGPKMKPIPVAKPCGYDAVFQAKPPEAPKPAQTAIDRKTIASQFFEKAKQMFTSEELKKMKKAVVAMQGHAKSKDVRSYSQAAGEIVRLIARHATFQLGSGDRDSNMLLLFFRLLPVKYRDDIETMSLKLCFDGSSFCGMCKENLPPGHFGLLRSYMVYLLKMSWCRPSDEELPVSEYVTRAQDVWQLLIKTKFGVSPATLQAYLKLVPSHFASSTTTLVSELVASARMATMREADVKLPKGEGAVKTERFQLPSWSSCTARPGLSEMAAKAEPTWQSNTGQASDRKREAPPLRFNPYAKKKPVLEKLKPPTHSSHEPVSLAQPAANDKPSLASLIKSVESTGPFVKRSSADMVRSIQANAPSNMTCPVCDRGLKQPFLAECGHLACLSCWQGWLKRSSTCPLCRVPARLDALARAVFATQPGLSIPTSLSQLCGENQDATTKNDDESSDDELEICK